MGEVKKYIPSPTPLSTTKKSRLDGVFSHPQLFVMLNIFTSSLSTHLELNFPQSAVVLCSK